MDCHPPLKLKVILLIVFLLKSTTVIWLQGTPITGGNHSLLCVNDYLFTVNCSLIITPSENSSNSSSSYWLTFTRIFIETTYKCMLARTKDNYFCTFKTTDGMPIEDVGIFGDIDSYTISLCHSKNEKFETCDLLDGKYQPKENIKPEPPCRLSVSHNSSQYQFTWKSIYENHSDDTALTDSLQYELHYYKRGDTNKVPIYSESTIYSVEDKNFAPDTEYTARVRSSPNLVFYKGQWSDWSAETHWRTEPAVTDFSMYTFISELCKKVLIPICGIVIVILLMCYAPIKKWKQNAFVPTPAPYFHTLYTDCQGDFKSWVVTKENTADMLKEEETLHIDTLTKCADVQEEDYPFQFHHQLMEGRSSYSNMTSPACDITLLGIPYAVSTMAPLSAQGSPIKSLILDSQMGSPAGDSGCWLCSDTSLERDTPWYCNEYCTLSAFQQSSSVLAKHHGSL